MRLSELRTGEKGVIVKVFSASESLKWVLLKEKP